MIKHGAELNDIFLIRNLPIDSGVSETILK